MIPFCDKGRWTIPVCLFVFTFCQTVQCQCFRSLAMFDATHDYQEFSSPGYPVYYSSNMYCIWKIYALNSSDAIKLEIMDSSIEYDYFCSYDYCQVFDGSTVLYAASLGKFCGTSRPSYVSTNDSMTVLFITDSSTTAYGFKARYISGPRSSLLDDESAGSIDLAVTLGATLGCLAFILLITVIFVLAYKYKQAKTLAEVRPSPRTTRPVTAVRVRPCDYQDDEGYYHRQLPPAYEDIQGPSMFQPPNYSATDNFSYPAAAAFPGHMDSDPNYWSSEKKKDPWKKVPLDDKTDMVPNSHFASTTSRRGTVTNIGNNVPGSSSAGTSGVNSMHTLNPATLGTDMKTGKHAVVPPRGKSLTKNVKVPHQNQFADNVPSTKRMPSANANTVSRLDTSQDTKTKSKEEESGNLTTPRQDTSADNMSISSDVSLGSLLK